MIEASTAFAQAVARSHRVASRVDVLFSGDVILEDVQVVDAVVTLDRTQPRFGSATVVVADADRLPLGSSDVLTPYGYELRIWRGIDLATGPELLPIGTFPIQSSSVDATTRLTTLWLQDRSRLVSDARFIDDWVIADGTNIVTAVEALLDDAVTGLEYLFPSTSYSTSAALLTRETDRWAEAQKLTESIGLELRFDGLGRPEMIQPGSFQDVPSSTISTGVNMTGATVRLDRSTAYNACIAFSSNPATDEVFQGEAFDNDPASPTFYDGPFGKRPRFYASPFINSTAQATAAAASVLAGELGVARSVDVSAVPDPRWQPSDVIEVVNSTLGIDELFIIDAVQFGLSPAAPALLNVRAQQEQT